MSKSRVGKAARQLGVGSGTENPSRYEIERRSGARLDVKLPLAIYYFLVDGEEEMKEVDPVREEVDKFWSSIYG